MEQIKMCPFCGSENVKLSDYKNYVLCDDCRGFGPTSNNPDNAILLWNAAANQIEALRKERDDAISELNAIQLLYYDALDALDEARAWARKLYRVCEDELKMVKLINDTFRDSKVLDNLNNLTALEKCTCGTTVTCPIHKATIISQRYWCDTTDKAQP